MAKKSAKPRERRPAPLDRLRAEESTQVLRWLACRYPGLRGEIEELALPLIESVDAEKVGSKLGRRLFEVDIFGATDTAPRDGRCVPMWEIAGWMVQKRTAIR